MADEPEDKGYTVKDRRYLHMSDEEKARLKEEEEAARREAEPEAEPPGADIPLPVLTFAAFLISLSSSAFAQLGDLPDPITGEQKKNLPLAKQTIDLLGVLREKTRNNLDPEEEHLFDHLLYDLRLRYVKEVQ